MIYTFQFDLQYFQGEKTEKATPKKRRDARKKGQVVQTKEIGGAISLILVFLTIQIFIKFTLSELFGIYNMIIDLSSTTQIEFTMATFKGILERSLISILKISLPLLMVALVVGLMSNYFQVGFLFTTETLKFKLSKLNPIKGFKRLFSLKSLVEMTKSILKAAGVLIICYNYVSGKKEVLTEIMGLSVAQGMLVVWDILFGIVIRCASFLLFIAILDFAYKKWENEKEMKMSKQEVKDEYKQMEGDPFIKGKIKEKQRQMAMSRMMQEVPDADVVITNPTHYAVAIKYEQNEDSAPIVVAKGKDVIAGNIKKVAKENDVMIVENKPLARLLYANIEIGEEITPDLYEAVADVLAYVYKIKLKA